MGWIHNQINCLCKSLVFLFLRYDYKNRMAEKRATDKNFNGDAIMVDDVPFNKIINTI